MRSIAVTLAFLVGWLAYPAALFTADDDSPVAKNRSHHATFVASTAAHGAVDDEDGDEARDTELVTVW